MIQGLEPPIQFPLQRDIIFSGFAGFDQESFAKVTCIPHNHNTARYVILKRYELI